MPSYPIDVKVDPSNAVAGSRRVKTALKDTRTEASALKSTMAGLFAGAAVSAAITRSIKLLANFSQEMSTVRAVTRATESEFSALQSTAETLGRTTRFSASQAAEGMTFLARAGFDADQVLGSIGDTLNLAQAGGLSLASAADIASNALQGMRLEVDQTGRVVDVFALAANSSNTNVQQLGNAMAYVAPIASGLGVSLEQTTSAIGALSDAGIQGSSAGTGLRRVLVGLENPSKEAEKILASLGVTADQVRVSQVGLSSALELLSKKGLTTAQALEIFGDRGGPAAEVLLQVAQGADGAESALGAMTRSLEAADGTADRIAETMDDNLNGSILAAKSALEGLIIALGNAGATDASIAIFDGIATALRFAAENTDLLTVALIALSVSAAAPVFLPLIAGARTAMITLQATTIMLGATGAAMNAASVSAAVLGRALMSFAAANPVLLGITAITAAYYFLRKETVDTAAAISNLEGTMSKYKSANSAIQKDTVLLKRRQEELSDAIIATGTAAQSAALLEIDAISKRIDRNEDLKESYRSVLAAQLVAARAAQAHDSDRSLAKATGVELYKGIYEAGVWMGDQRKTEVELSLEANAALETQLKHIEAINSVGGKLSDKQRDLLDLNIKRKEEAHKILSLEEAIAAIDTPAKPAGASGGGGGGGAVDKVDIDFEAQFTSLQKETAALALNSRAREARNKVLSFEKDLERDFANGERSRVVAEIEKQQALLDDTAIRDRIRDIGSENAVLGLNARAAEARGAVLRLERDILRKLAPEEERLLMAVIEQNQALRDDVAIQSRLTALSDQAELLKKVGVEADVASEIMRLQNQLERELSDTEKSWIENAVNLNDEMSRRNAILSDAKQPTEDLKSDLAVINSLFTEGAFTAREYAAALSDISLANEGLDIDAALNAGGANFGPSQFEQTRILAEEGARAEEGGGLGEDVDSGFGFSGQEMGIEDELQAERDNAQQKLDLLRQMQDAEYLQENEFLRRKEELLRQSTLKQEDIFRKGAQLRLSNAESLFGSVTDILGATLGEQSGLYKAAFVAQKAAAIGQSIVAIQSGIAQAAALPFPANVGAMATVAAATASIVGNIQAVRLKLREGGHVGERFDGIVSGAGSRKSDSVPAMLSRDEFVVQADNAQQSLGLLNAINNGHINDNDMSRTGFMNGGSVGSAPSNAFGGSGGGGGTRGGTVINMGGLTVEVKGDGGDNPKDIGEQVGEAVMRTLVESVLTENVTQPGGIIYERLA